MALEFTFGNLIGGVVGSNIFLAKEAPVYKTGYHVEISFYSAGVVLCLVQLAWLVHENRKRASQVQGMPDDQRANLDAENKDLGDKNPLFRYTY